MAPSVTSPARPASMERAASSSVPPAKMGTPATTSMAGAPIATRAGLETGKCGGHGDGAGPGELCTAPVLPARNRAGCRFAAGRGGQGWAEPAGTAVGLEGACETPAPAPR